MEVLGIQTDRTHAQQIRTTAIKVCDFVIPQLIACSMPAIVVISIWV